MFKFSWKKRCQIFKPRKSRKNNLKPIAGHFKIMMKLSNNSFRQNYKIEIYQCSITYCCANKNFKIFLFCSISISTIFSNLAVQWFSIYFWTVLPEDLFDLLGREECEARQGRWGICLRNLAKYYQNLKYKSDSVSTRLCPLIFRWKPNKWRPKRSR